MSDSVLDTREDLISTLNGVRNRLDYCAYLDQRLSHSRHRNDYYRDLINRVDTLIDAERALNLRVKTVGR